jgi:hypothetical protein
MDSFSPSTTENRLCDERMFEFRASHKEALAGTIEDQRRPLPCRDIYPQAEDEQTSVISTRLADPYKLQ